MLSTKIEYDPPWKNILHRYFKSFMAYCYPRYYAAIDWDKGYVMLDKELSKLMLEATAGNKIVDKLVKVHLTTGKTSYILVHIELQASREQDFAKRMFNYYCRLRHLHDVPIASLAVLLDRDLNWRPCTFKEQVIDSSIKNCNI